MPSKPTATDTKNDRNGHLRGNPGLTPNPPRPHDVSSRFARSTTENRNPSAFRLVAGAPRSTTENRNITSFRLASLAQRPRTRTPARFILSLALLAQRPGAGTSRRFVSLRSLNDRGQNLSAFRLVAGAPRSTTETSFRHAPLARRLRGRAHSQAVRSTATTVRSDAERCAASASTRAARPSSKLGDVDTSPRASFTNSCSSSTYARA